MTNKAQKLEGRAGARTQQALLCVALFAVAYASNGVASVLLFYTVNLRLQASALALFFTAYAIGLALAFVFGGPLSDRRGRKPLVVLGAAGALVSLIILLGAAIWGTPMLTVGRFIQGLGSGAVYAIGTVWLRELMGSDKATSAAVWATAAMAAGFGCGSIVSGALVQWAAWPRLLSLFVMVVLVAGSVAIVYMLPESHAGQRGQVIAIGLPRATWWGFFCYLVPCGLIVYPFVMLGFIVFPVQMERVGFKDIYFVQGLSLTVIMAVTTWATTWVRKLGAARAGWIAAVLGAIGCGLGYIAVQPDQWLWVIPASVAIGAGSGLAITSGVVVSDLLAPAESRASVLALFYVLVYVGVCVPTILSLVGAPNILDQGSTILGLGVAGILVAVILAGPGRIFVHRLEHASNP